MRKITLGIDGLLVETFATAETAPDFGVGAEGGTESCEPDPMSRCGPNVCDPAFDLTNGSDC